ncbi:MAG TPA: hypothetical protein VNL18_09555 [Gemmatimonadales bacterium]|nr:hypothetical protein [Gemmatimonadales bacterium]
MIRALRSVGAAIGMLLLTLSSLTGSAIAQRRQPQPAAAPSTLDPSSYRQLRYRYVGPVGNRTTSAVGIPGDPNIYYIGAASGGIWKTVDGGVHWSPIFDDYGVQSIGALALAPSNPNIVWAGTGEAHIRSHISIGNGVYKSLDAGKTWTRMGLENSGRIARVVIHPANPDIVFVCSQGHSYGPQADRGVFRTTDGGKTWDNVLFVDENTGCSDVAMDPTNPAILFAGFWTIEIKTWGRVSGGPGSGLYVSRDGGATWRKLRGNGLPRMDVGKTVVAIARSNPNHVYSLIETGDGVPVNGVPQESGELWTSLDGGETWTLTSHDRQLAGRTHYYSRVVVSPDNENEAYFLSAAFSKSIDGGRTVENLGFGQSPGGDNHDIWIDPTNGDRMIVANDQGVAISTTRGRQWDRIQLPIAQMYHVTTDTKIPYNLFGNRQDGPSYVGPSNAVRAAGFGGGGGGGGNIISRGEWHEVGGGESGWATPDPVDPDIVWSSASGRGSVGGIVVRYDMRSRQFRHVEIWPEVMSGSPAALAKYRFVWTAPLTISPHDHNKVYVGSQHVHATTDGGHSWQVISPDLTLNDRSKMGPSGGLTPDNIGVEYAGVVFAIAESRLKPGLIWAGTNDGLVHVTRDGGRNWTNVTANITGLPAWGTISNIEPSRYDTGTAYITVDFHQMNNRDPWVYKTSDYGRTWRKITNGITPTPLSYAHVIREDPVRRGLLYLGLENALYVSFNDGESWQPLQNNLPPAPVYWMEIQEHFMDLVIATYGRGWWIMDDITPLQQLTPQVLAADAHLFELKPAYRFRPVTPHMGSSDDPVAGQGPPYGASINYWLKSAPEGDVTITIADASGQTVRTLRGTKNVGINRVMWDLRDEPTPEVRLRVSPVYAPYVQIPPEGRPAPMTQRLSILQPPGTYTVKLMVDGREYARQLIVRKDPNSAGTEADIAQQVALLGEIKRNTAETADMLNRIETIRWQLQNTARVAGDAGNREAKAAVDSVEQKFIDLEWELHQIMVTGRGQEDIRYPHKLIQKLVYLAGGVATADFPPTTQAREVHAELTQRLAGYRARFDQLVRQDLATLNETLRRRNMPNVISAR